MSFALSALALRRLRACYRFAGGVLLALSFVTCACAQAPEGRPEVAVGLRNEARSYEHGEGVEKDATFAAELYCEAAKLGDAEAQFSLGWMYANGRGVTKADDVAAFFFSLAAEQGHEHAQRMLRFVGSPAATAPDCMRPKPTPAPMAAQVTIDGGFADFSAGTPAEQRALRLVQKLAPEYGVSSHLALAIIRTESNFDPLARSGKNAQGLMQLIPETAARFNVLNPFDPAQNIRGGLAYLRWLLAYFRGNVQLVAAAYNAGEGAVNRYRGVPPFSETRTYVERIMQLFGRTEHPYDPQVTTPSPMLGRIPSPVLRPLNSGF